MRKRDFIILTLAIFFCVNVYNFYKKVIKQDYIVAAAISCDPNEEACFRNNCLEVSDSGCLGTRVYYKIIKKKAYGIPECYNIKETDKSECPPLVCGKDEYDCMIETCEVNDEFDIKCLAYF